MDGYGFLLPFGILELNEMISELGQKLVYQKGLVPHL